MSNSQLTKHALSVAMKELMTECSMEKIKISDIVERCNMNRQSFYYHFKDKYDLVNWIYYTEFFGDIQNSLDKPGWDLLEKICEYFYENREFYCNALQVKGQNSFSEYFAEVIHPLIQVQFEEIFEDDPDRFYATFYSDAIRISITRWLLEGAKLSPREFVQMMKNAATGVAYKLILNLEEEIND